MLQVSLALIISSLLAYAAIQTQIQAARMEYAALQGGNMGVLQAAAGKYAAEFYRELQTGAAVTKGTVTLASGTTSGQTYAPTVANLIAMGYLTSGFSTQSSFSNGGAPGNYQIRIERSPAGCVTTACDIEGYVYPDLPITSPGSTEPDGPAITAIIAPLRENGGFSINVSSSVIYGNGGGWTWANPLAGSPAGVVVAKFGYGSAGLSQFVRMNDDRNPNLQGALTVLNGVTADSYVTATKTVGGACSVANALASGAGTVLICTGTVWKALTETGVAGAACSPDGKVVTSGTGAQLICKNSVFISSISLVPKNVLVSRQTVSDGDTVTKPTCESGGTADRSFSLTRISTDVSVAPPKQSMYVSTTDLGSSWQVVIRLRTDTGTESSGSLYNVTAVLNLECRY